MNEAIILCLVTAIQALAPPAPGAPVLDRLSPFDGDALDLTTRSGQSLFFEGTKALPTTFSGKVEELFLFIADLKNKTTICRWDATHDIINTSTVGTATVPSVILNLITDYARLTKADVLAAQVSRNAPNALVRAKQNSRMMYTCLYDSVTDDAKNRMLADDGAIVEDGPTFFYRLVTSTFTTTFSSAQSTRDQLSNLQPRRYKYEITAINNVIRIAVSKLKASAGTNESISFNEIFYYQFKIYKKIRSPTDWITRILFLENKMTSDPSYHPEDLYNDSELQFNKLLDDGQWKPSDKSPEEQAIAMAAAFTSPPDRPPKSDKPPDKNKHSPPFAQTAGKEGDSKTWNGKTYYWCPARHRNGHWHPHKLADCNTLKKWRAQSDHPSPSPSPAPAGDGDSIVVNRAKLKQAMAALINTDDYNVDDLAAGLHAALLG